MFGPFLIPALLILLEETVAPRLLPASRRLKLSGVILLGLGVLFSYSRAAWLDLAVALVTMLAVLLLRRHSARTTARLLAVLFVILVCGGRRDRGFWIGQLPAGASPLCRATTLPGSVPRRPASALANTIRSASVQARSM